MSQPEKMASRIQNYHKKTFAEYQAILEHNQQLKNTLKDVQNELYIKTKPIRVTDDDYSTIISNLGKLFGKINNFPPNCKSFLKKDVDIRHLFSPQDQKQLQSLPVDNALLSILVEKYIIEILIEQVFQKGVHLNDTINTAYNSVSQLFKSAQHDQWAKDLRLKTARSTWETIHANPPTISSEKQRVVQKLMQGLSLLYPESVIQERLEKLVDMAADLCLPLHGQDNPIEIYFPSPSDKIIESQVKHVYHQLHSNSIYLSISPVFLAKSTLEADDDILETYLDGYTLVYPGKAIW